MKFYILIFFSLFSLSTFSQQLKVDKVEPPNWWKDMKLNQIQIMIYGKNLDITEARFDNEDIKVLQVHKIDNKDYAFVDVQIPSSIKGGTYNLIIKGSKGEAKIPYSILDRVVSKDRHQGFSNKDAVYLIFPDRFANGNTKNDIVDGYLNEFNPKDGGKRHGGDLQGIIDKLPYIKDLGFTAIWINPILENNTTGSYHHYAATDMYKIDPRLGSNELYKKLVEEAHKLGIKIIFDHVANHVSDDHPWVKNFPVPNWLNGTIEDHFITNHNKTSFMDINGDSTTVEKNIRGWFVSDMPDLNQENPYVAKYLIQNMIWWMEYTGLDGIREDTYPYPDQEFMADWGKAILEEYPTTNITGECWITEPSFIAYYQMGSKFRKDNSYLPSVMDFAMMFGYQDWLLGTKNLNNIYEIFAQDFVYENKDNLFCFIDNHDHQRAGYAANGNMDKVAAMLQLLLTTRGIPQILYGTEIGMVGGPSHPELRMDFPGGFNNSTRNAFEESGRTKKENEIFNELQTLLKVRKEYPSLASGKFKQFPPENEIYIYFKTQGDEKIMGIINGNKNSKTVDLSSVKHLLADVKEYYDIKTGKNIKIENYKLEVDGYTGLLIKCNK